MGKYTIQTDPRIDRIIDDHLSIIMESTLKYIRPLAILLAGSFGRGEGSIYMNEGEPNFISDYEVCLISSNPAARIKVDLISQDVKNKIPAEVSLFWDSPARILHNRSRNLSFGSPRASIGMYELKAGSMIIYGAFDLSINPIDPSTLPISEGIRLIINRMMGVVEAWNNHSTQEIRSATLTKLLLACGDALLIRNGIYHFSYQERANRFECLYNNRYQNQYDSEFLQQYKKAARLKLDPRFIKDFSIENALKTATLVTRQILIELTGVNNRSNADIVKSCSYAIPLLYQTGVFPVLDRPYEDLILALRARRARAKINYSLLPRISPRPTPFQALYGAIPSLFWNLLQSDAELTELTCKWGAWALPQHEPSRGNDLTSSLVQMWHILG
jgi:hypothetical protein